SDAAAHALLRHGAAADLCAAGGAEADLSPARRRPPARRRRTAKSFSALEGGEGFRMRWVSRYRLRQRCALRLGGDRLEAPARHVRAEEADDDEDDHHCTGNETEHADCSVLPQEEGDEKAREDGAEPAPGIDEAHRLGADAGGIELGL